MHRANASDRPKTTYDPDDEIDIDYSQAIIDIGLHINKAEVTTIGAIRRAFPEHERVILTVLKSLKLDGICNYDEFSPAPTRVFSGSMRMAMPNHWNNSAVYGKVKKQVGPDASVFEGRDRVMA